VYKQQITKQASVTAASGDTLLISDVSDSDKVKKVTAQSIADLASGGVSDGDKGDIVVSGSGSTWTIDNGVVSLAKQANVASGTVFYRKTASSGAPEVQTLATLKTDLGLTGTNSGDQTSIVGIGGTKSQFDSACSDGNFVYVGDVCLVKYLYFSATAVGNVGSGEDNLMTYALDAGKLATDGDRLFIRMSFTYADNANAKRIRVYFGTDVCFDTTSLAFQNGKVVADIEIIRTGATAQLITSGVWQRFVLGAATYTPAGAEVITGTQTLSSSVTIKATGEATSNDDIVQKSVSIMYYPYG